MKALNLISTLQDFKREPRSVTTNELKNAFNANIEQFGGKPVKRFADRETAERRVAKLLDLIEEAAQVGEPVVGTYSHCPCCGVDLENGYSTHFNQVSEKLPGHEMFEYGCLACDGEFGPLIKERAAVDSARSEGVARSWFNEEVRIKRSTRHGVVVKSRSGLRQEYRSVRQAFAELGLPLSKHIRFRMELKAEGQLNAHGYSWEIVEL